MIKAYLIMEKDIYYKNTPIENNRWECEYNNSPEAFLKRAKEIRREAWVEKELIGLLYEDDSFVSQASKNRIELGEKNIMIGNYEAPKVNSDIKPKYIVTII